jgi:hypothetical protein
MHTGTQGHSGMRMPDYLSGLAAGGGGMNNFSAISGNTNNLAEMQGLGAQVCGEQIGYWDGLGHRVKLV